jgi:hypothetical protein
MRLRPVATIISRLRKVVGENARDWNNWKKVLLGKTLLQRSENVPSTNLGYQTLTRSVRSEPQRCSRTMGDAWLLAIRCE